MVLGFGFKKRSGATADPPPGIIDLRDAEPDADAATAEHVASEDGGSAESAPPQDDGQAAAGDAPDRPTGAQDGQSAALDARSDRPTDGPIDGPIDRDGAADEVSEAASTADPGDEAAPGDPSDREPVAAPPAWRRAIRSAAARGKVDAVLGALVLSPRSGRGIGPAGAVVAAVSWALATVLLGSLFVAAAIGLVTGGGVLQPATFVSVWRVAHLMPVATADGPVSLLPLLPVLLVLAVLLRATSWLWDRSVGAPGTRGLVGLGMFGGGYLVAAGLIATSPTSGSQATAFSHGLTALLGLVGLVLAITWLRGTLRTASPRVWALLRGAATVLGVTLSVATLMLLASVLLSWSELQHTTTALLESGIEPAGRFDALALGALQLAYLPNLVVWIASYLVGAGFVVGAGTIISPFSVTVGTLPELPVLVVLPEEPLRVPWLPVLLVAGCSIVAGVVIRGSGLAWRMRTRIVAGAVVAFVTAVAMMALAAASSGGLGAGRLEHVGPIAPVTAAWTLLAVGLGQLTWALFPTVVADLVPFARHARDLARGVRVRDRRARSRRRARRQRARGGGGHGEGGHGEGGHGGNGRSGDGIRTAAAPEPVLRQT